MISVRIISTLETPNRALRDYLVGLGFAEGKRARKGMLGIEYREDARDVLDAAIREFMQEAITRDADIDIAAALHALGTVPTRMAIRRVKLQARERPQP